MIGPRDCPRWEGCSAPVCPLDGAWHRCKHLPGERVCGLMSELVKDGGEARLRASLPSALFNLLAEASPLIASRWGRVRKRLDEASRTGSRMAAGQRLARCKGVAIVDACNVAAVGAGAADRMTAPPACA